MLFFALSNLNNFNILDVANTDYTSLNYNNSKANLINKEIKNSILNGVTPDIMDQVLGEIIGDRLTVNADKNITDMIWNNPDLFTTMVSKELRNLVYWLNEWLDIDDVNTVINAATNKLLFKMQGKDITISDNIKDVYRRIKIIL